METLIAFHPEGFVGIAIFLIATVLLGLKLDSWSKQKKSEKEVKGRKEVLKGVEGEKEIIDAINDPDVQLDILNNVLGKFGEIRKEDRDGTRGSPDRKSDDGRRDSRDIFFDRGDKDNQ